MSKEEFATPETVNAKELKESIKELAEQVKAMKDSQIPVEKPTSLTETVKPTYDYRQKLAEMIRDPNRTGDFIWGKNDNRGEDLRLFETIGAASAGSAVPEIWAADVFRCCPYPASAFWDAPFIKWHEDIHGKLEESQILSGRDQGILFMS